MPKLDEILGTAYAQIPEDLKKKYKDIDLVDSTNYIEKKDYDTVKKERDQYKKDIKKRDTDLETLQEKVKDNEELNLEIEKLKKENKKAADDYKVELEKITFESKLEKKLISYNPQNVAILKKALDLSKVSLDGDNFLGLDEQIKSLNETDKYLFKESKPEDIPGGTGTIGSDNNNNNEQTDTNSIGGTLAKAKTENINSEAQSKFFS
ncbi:phage scaffolding protein [Clostridium ihumii]|uniref:phage scaffolding protein n=1 Tax=Clostridium ihumii TaxID=1470356 RepID=UPI0005912CAD|nr:phage scaffolding protein [Clostridium ihumii]